MPRSRRSSSSLSGRFVVTGPHEDDHPVENVGMGCATAQGFASKHRKQHAGEELTYYVRDLAGLCFAQITKRDNGVIETTAVTP